jgi:hypothetical protein
MLLLLLVAVLYKLVKMVVARVSSLSSRPHRSAERK